MIMCSAMAIELGVSLRIFTQLKVVLISQIMLKQLKKPQCVYSTHNKFNYHIYLLQLSLCQTPKGEAMPPIICPIPLQSLFKGGIYEVPSRLMSFSYRDESPYDKLVNSLFKSRIYIKFLCVNFLQTSCRLTILLICRLPCTTRLQPVMNKHNYYYLGLLAKRFCVLVLLMGQIGIYFNI